MPSPRGRCSPARTRKASCSATRLAANLGVTLGKKVVYTMTDKRGQIVEGLARVSGIVRTGAPSVDGGLCLLPIDTLRRVLGYAANEATEVAVFIRDQRRSDEVAARLGARLDGDAVALPWYETQAGLAGFIAMKVGGANFMKILIAVLIAAGIFNTLFVSITERMREFGIMLAIGYSPRDIYEMVMLESLWLGLVGLTIGTAITARAVSVSRRDRNRHQRPDRTGGKRGRGRGDSAGAQGRRSFRRTRC